MTSTAINIANPALIFFRALGSDTKGLLRSAETDADNLFHHDVTALIPDRSHCRAVGYVNIRGEQFRCPKFISIPDREVTSEVKVISSGGTDALPKQVPSHLSKEINKSMSVRPALNGLAFITYTNDQAQTNHFARLALSAPYDTNAEKTIVSALKKEGSDRPVESTVVMDEVGTLIPLVIVKE